MAIEERGVAPDPMAQSTEPEQDRAPTPSEEASKGPLGAAELADYFGQRSLPALKRRAPQPPPDPIRVLPKL